MSERGTFAVDRGIWGNVAFAREPFTEREAFLWLISEAAYVAREKRVGSDAVALERGQTCHSIRFMADAWQWSKSRVDRFITRLENRDMVIRDSGTDLTLLTICNYEQYQPKQKSNGTHVGTGSGTPAGHQRDKLEKGNNTSLRSVVTSSARRHVWPADYREQFWAAYPRHTARKKGWEALDKIAVADAVSFADLIAGCHRLRKAVSDVRFAPHPATWLNGERWEDDIPAEPKAQSRPGRSGNGATLDLWAADALDANTELQGGHDDHGSHDRARNWDRAGRQADGRPYRDAPQSAGNDPRQLPPLRLVGGL